MTEAERIEVLSAALEGMIKLARIEEKNGSKTWGRAANLAEDVLDNPNANFYPSTENQNENHPTETR